jgi:flagellar basal-body rod protein FlgB
LFQGAVDVIIGGTHTQFLAAALRGLDTRREANEHNIANVETPEFRAREVSFEGALRRAIETDDPSRIAISTVRSLAPTRPDGNNVRLDHELTALEENALHQRLLTEAVNDHFGRLRATLGR